MPAPIAKGLIISLSILLAAGLAVYENPQVRQWVDESRRKIAIALHSLGDDINPRQPSSSDPDASTREDDSPDAEERRRKARQEILERGRMMEERRKKAKEGQKKTNSQSFDDVVDQEGRLRQNETAVATKATAAEPVDGDVHLRKRKAEDGAALGSRLANPFDDEIMLMDLHPDAEEDAPPIPPRPCSQTPPPVPPKIPHDESSRLAPQPILIPTSSAFEHPSEPLVDLTPVAVTPTTSTLSTSHADLLSLDQDLDQDQDSHTSTPSFIESPSHSRSSTPSIIASPAASSSQQHPSYFSVNEWAENTSASFYTPPRAQIPTPARTPPIVLPDEGPSSSTVELSQNSSKEVVQVDESHAMSEDDTRYGFESDSEMDIISQISEDGGMTPSSWTEVGSTVSDDER